jgi:hypothetical protein
MGGTCTSRCYHKIYGKRNKNTLNKGKRVFNVTFNNISGISWRSVLLVEETGVPGENHRHVASHWQNISHNVVSSKPRHQRDLNSQIYFSHLSLGWRKPEESEKTIDMSQVTDKLYHIMLYIAPWLRFELTTVISWWSVLLVEESGVPGENHRPGASH